MSGRVTRVAVGQGTRRAVCDACQRPAGTCLCRWVVPVRHTTEVLILQHPLEVQHAKNSARLLHMSLDSSRLLVGEAFDTAALYAALEGPATNVLLYPQCEQPAATMPAWRPDAQAPTAPVRLVVLDATWRKSRKMLHQNPLLQGLPRLSLDVAQASRYLIRKSHKPGQLSTLEATCAALAQLEGDANTYEPVLQAFDGFVAQQLAFMAR